MKINPKKVNVEKIVAEIRRDIGKRVQMNEIGLYLDVPERVRKDNAPDFGDLEENLNLLCGSYEVATWRPLRSERKLGRLILFVKKIIRGCISFYVVPIVTDQNENNRLIASCLEDVLVGMDEMSERIQALEEENAKLRGLLDSQKDG